jgi:hypothetical protein
MVSTKQITITASLIAIAAVLVLFAGPIVTTHQAHAHMGSWDSRGTTGTGTGTTGINISTDKHQTSTCATTGGNSPITNQCNLASTITVSNTAGVIK